MGMKTVWIENEEPWAKKFSDSSFVNFKIKNLSNLMQIWSGAPGHFPINLLIQIN